ncbi:hypothetical protein CR513_60468, partial [Mucuna pruriens]
MDKTPAATRHMISNMASNTQYFQPKTGKLANQLTSLVRQLAVSQHQLAMAAKVCGICTSVEHLTDMCLALQETKSDQPEHAGAYARQPYQTRPIDNQQYGRQPFQPSPPQGPYAAQRASPALNMPQGSTGKSAIPSTTFPTTTVAAEGAYSRQLSISGGSDEAACSQQYGVLAICELQQYAILTKRDRHHPRPQNADRIVGQHCEPITVDWIQQPPLSNHSKSEWKCQCSHSQKWKRIASTYTAAVAEASRNRVVTVSPRENCPSAIPNSDHLNKKARVR